MKAFTPRRGKSGTAMKREWLDDCLSCNSRSHIRKSPAVNNYKLAKNICSKKNKH